MEPIYINSAIAALGYAIAATLSKHALAQGAGILRLSFVANWLFLPVFALLLIGHEFSFPLSYIGFPLLTGLFFFLGQMFTFAAIRLGDISLQTPVMGTKTVFVVLIALALGTEPISKSIILAAVVSMFGVALLGFSGGGARRVGMTLCLALLSSLFFAATDMMVSAYGSQFNASVFIFIVILVNAVLSLLLVPFFDEPLIKMPKAAWTWVLVAGVIMAAQALLLNYTLAHYQNAAVFNVVYSTRGLWSVVIGVALAYFLRMPTKKGDGRLWVMRLTGALMMCAAILILQF